LEDYLINGSLWQTLGVGIGIIALVLAYLNRKAIYKFYHEVKTELKKCTWPWDPDQSGLKKYKTLIDSSVIVIVSTILLAGYTSGFDFLLNNLVALLISF